MSQTEQPTNDVGDENGESEDSQTETTKAPPTAEELKAAAATAQQNVNAEGEGQKAVAGNHHGENQTQHRAKKAQKTKGRVRINVPGNDAQNQQQPQQQQQQQQQPKKKQKQQPETVGDDEEDDYVDEDEDDEPSRLIPAIVGCFQAIGSFFKMIFMFVGALFMRLFGLLVGLFKLVWKVLCRVVPLLAGIPLYCLVLYLTSEYVVTQFESDRQLDINCRLNYILRCHAFTLLPVLFGLIVSSQMDGKPHTRFYHESYEQVVLLVLNTLIMNAHCGVDQLHWVWCITIGYLTFSLPYWISLAYGGEKLQSTLRSPIVVTNVALMLYNVVLLSGQYFGYFGPETVEPESLESAGAYWQFSTCGMPQRGYCGDRHSPMTGFGYHG